jgi:hypothetical protein
MVVMIPVDWRAENVPQDSFAVVKRPVTRLEIENKLRAVCQHVEAVTNSDK